MPYGASACKRRSRVKAQENRHFDSGLPGRPMADKCPMQDDRENSTGPAKSKPNRPNNRDERLKQSLRANLQRRKAKKRALNQQERQERQEQQEQQDD